MALTVPRSTSSSRTMARSSPRFSAVVLPTSRRPSLPLLVPSPMKPPPSLLAAGPRPPAPSVPPFFAPLPPSFVLALSASPGIYIPHARSHLSPTLPSYRVESRSVRRHALYIESIYESLSLTCVHHQQDRDSRQWKAPRRGHLRRVRPYPTTLLLSTHAPIEPTEHILTFSLALSRSLSLFAQQPATTLLPALITVRVPPDGSRSLYKPPLCSPR